MTESKHTVRFPGESPEYRTARDELLNLEMEFRRNIEAVAAKRRQLPLGGRVDQDYVFERSSADSVEQVRLSEMFAPGKDSLIIYSYMFGPNMAEP